LLVEARSLSILLFLAFGRKGLDRNRMLLFSIAKSIVLDVDGCHREFFFWSRLFCGGWIRRWRFLDAFLSASSLKGGKGPRFPGLLISSPRSLLSIFFGRHRDCITWKWLALVTFGQEGSVSLETRAKNEVN